MGKLFTELEVFCDAEKKLIVDPSALAVTSILTPLTGMVEVIVTTSGKSGPGAGAWFEPEAGVV